MTAALPKPPTTGYAGLHGLLLAGLCLSLLLPLVFAALVWYDLDRENTYVAERARIIAQSVERQLAERLDVLAGALRQAAGQSENARIPLEQGLGTALRDVVLVRDGVAVDRAGHPADASWLPLPDPDSQPAGLAIGAPTRDAVSGRALVPVAWDGPSTRVGARIDGDWFAAVLQGYDLGAQSMLNLVHRDRVLLARSTDNQRYAGKRLDRTPIFDRAHANLVTGEYIEASVIDGVVRQFVFDRLPHSPLVVVVGSARIQMLAGWRRFAAFALAAAILLGALWFWLSRAFGRSHATQAQLLDDLRAQSDRGEEARRIAQLGDWSWNLDTGEVTWSQEIFAIYGLPPSYGAFPIEEIPDRVHPDDQDMLRARLTAVLEGAEPSDMNYRIVRPDGEVRVVHARAEWLDRTPGRRTMRGIQQDVTELANTRERLRAVQGEYRFLFQHNPLPMWVFDRQTLRFLAVNDAMLTAYGYSRDELLVTTMLQIRPAEDTEAVKAAAQLDSSERPQGRVWTHLYKDGTRVRVAVHTRDIDFEDRPARLVLAVDVTERERSEERFQMIARAISDAVWDWDLVTGETWRSDNVYPLFGYSRDEIGPTLMGWSELLHPDDRARVVESVQAGIDTGATEWECSYRFLRKDGTYADVFDRGFIMRDQAGRAFRAVGGMLDVTQKHRDEADLRLLRRAIEATESGILIADMRQAHLPTVYVNRGFEVMSGYNAAELLGKDCRFLGFDERDLAAVKTIRRGLREHTEMRMLLRNLRKDGTPFWNDFYMAPVRDEAGRVTHMVSVFSDVTERQRTEQRFQLVARATSDAIWDWDIATNALWWSDSFYTLFGYSRDEVTATLESWEQRIHPDDLARVLRDLEKVLASSDTEWHDNYRFLRKDGSYAEVFDSGFLLRDDSGKALRAVGGMLDVTQKHRDESDLRLLRRAVESADNGIVIADARLSGLPAVFVNHAFEKMTGYTSAEILGSTFHFLREGDEDQPEIVAIRQAIAEQRELRVLLRDHRKDGELFWNDFHVAPVRDDSGALTHFVSIQSDVTERQRILEQLAYRATYDELTGLPNRQLLTDRLQQAINNAERYQRAVAVLLVDLDDFKLINDSLGHSAGDVALRTVARRFEAAVRPSDTLSRFGGDEFVAVLTEQTDEDDVGRVIERISAALAQPVEIAGAPHYITASIGYCRYPDAGDDAEALLKHADMAMYQAKQQGRNRAVAYRAEFDAGIGERLHLVSALRDALQREEFRLAFQPLFSSHGVPVGMEALVRWQHPERGLLPPSHFIGVCEDSGLIVPLGRWVLQEAARHHAQLAAHGLGHLRIAVNVSTAQFQQSLFADVQDAMRMYALPTGALELELTESVIMTSPDSAIDTMQRLDILGVNLSVDDFGTGYSSLAYLKRLPIDRLKIDRSFVNELGQGGDDDAICTAIITLAHSLGLRTVAEGVETPQQLAWLRARGCDELQGYLLCPPLPFEQMVKALQGGSAVWAPSAVA